MYPGHYPRACADDLGGPLALSPGVQRLTDLTLGMPPAPVPLDDSILDDMASDRLWGASPLAVHGVRHFHHEFHS